MDVLDTVSIGILLGALLVLAGILSSLVAMRFGAPLLLVFLRHRHAGRRGRAGRDQVRRRAHHLHGRLDRARLILFDGGLRTRFATFRNVLAPALTLATFGVLVTAALTAPVAQLRPRHELVRGAAGRRGGGLDRRGCGVLPHPCPRACGCARGSARRSRSNPAATIRSRCCSPSSWSSSCWSATARGSTSLALARRAGRARQLSSASSAGGSWCWCSTGWGWRRACMRRSSPRARSSSSVSPSTLHASGFLAVYLAGLVVGNQPTRAHNTVIVFLDAVTWLAQIVMFVLLGLLVWPQRLIGDAGAGAGGRAALMLVARPVAVFLCLSPFRFSLARADLHLLGRAARRGRHLPRLDPAAGRAAARLCLFRHRLRGGADLAADPGLDHRRRRAAAAHRAAAPRPAAAPGRARPARPARAGDRRLSGRAQQPLSAARPAAVLGAADAGGARREDPQPAGGRIRCGRATTSTCWRRRRRRRRSIASSSTCRRRRRPIRVCSAISSSRATSRSARWRRSTASPSRRRSAERYAGGPHRRGAQASQPQAGRHRAARADRAAGASRRRWPRHQRRPAAAGRTTMSRRATRRARFKRRLRRLWTRLG